jgi:putative DNA primase/helicase
MLAMNPESKPPGIPRMRFEGVWTRREIWVDPDMSRTEKTLLAQIESLDKLPRGCFAGNDYFAEFFQLSRRQIRRYITRLAARGWIQVVLTGRNRRRLQPTAKLRALREVEASEGRKRPSAEGQKCPPISTKKNSTGSHKTQDSARISRCELKQRSKLNCAAIPTELRSHAQWVVWRWEIRKGKWNKPPYQLSGKLAKANDATTWVSFEAVIEAFENGAYDGIGFVLTDDDLYAMADLDHCLDSAGNVKAWAAEVVEQLSSYTEITPSGEGLRVIVKAALPPGGRKRGMPNGGGVELYDRLRYMTMTGNHLAGTPETIEERQKKMAGLHARLFGKVFPSTRVATDDRRSSASLPDNELLTKARAARNSEKFRALNDRGDFSAYPSASEADLALCGILAFWTGGDAQQIDQLFRRSALFRREKWDEEHHADGRTYGEATVAKAVAGTREFYRVKKDHRDEEVDVERSK